MNDIHYVENKTDSMSNINYVYTNINYVYSKTNAMFVAKLQVCIKLHPQQNY